MIPSEQVVGKVWKLATSFAAFNELEFAIESKTHGKSTSVNPRWIYKVSFSLCHYCWSDPCRDPWEGESESLTQALKKACRNIIKDTKEWDTTIGYPNSNFYEYS